MPKKKGRYYRFQHPPVRATRKRALAFDIHDDVTHGEESFRREWLGEEISQVGCAAYEWYGDVVCLHALTHEEVTSVDML
eukprot:4705688-Pleurochrysis_carterae.AAC.1